MQFVYVYVISYNRNAYNKILNDDYSNIIKYSKIRLGDECKRCIQFSTIGGK